MPARSAAYYSRRQYHRLAARSTVRFPQAPREAAAPRIIRTMGGVDCARATAANYRAMAAKEGRPVTQAVYLRLAGEWDARAEEAIRRIRGPQQHTPGELFR